MNSPPPNALHSSGIGSPSASSSEGVAGFFTHEAAERERIRQLVLRGVPRPLAVAMVNKIFTGPYT